MNKRMKQEPTPAEVRGKVGFYLEMIEARKHDIASYEEKIIGLRHSCPHGNKTEIPVLCATTDRKSLNQLCRCCDCGALLNANNEVVPEP